MTQISRREFVRLAASLGASLAWVGQPSRSNRKWIERRDLFGEGVASGDPDSNSVLLWTRASWGTEEPVHLTVEVAEDDAFSRVIASTSARAVRQADYTCRVLVAGLRPNRTYWLPLRGFRR